MTVQKNFDEWMNISYKVVSENWLNWFWVIDSLLNEGTKALVMSQAENHDFTKMSAIKLCNGWYVLRSGMPISTIIGLLILYGKNMQGL